MGRIISIVNQKGGVGKSTTAMNVAAYLAHLGRFVLLIDLDPQANVTSGLGIDPRTAQRTIYHVLTGQHALRDIVQPTSHEGYRLIPSSADTAGANIELVSQERREFRLRDAILEIKNDYDYIIIDSPPSLGLLTINGLVAANEILIPVQCEYYALEGLGQLLYTI
ncbi:ParA family protein, partial [Candidatus Peregrinibacteria bacterium]|nr:ParA family protein [Candidatus Peregrinibacteria bacterium]